MASSDRAFRSFARANPASVVALLRLLAPSLVDVDESEIVALTDPNLDLPPHPRETDWAATVGADRLVHVECQGYRDRAFTDRLFDDHLRLTLRHPDRLVVSCALWLRAPTKAQRAPLLERGLLTLRPVVVVLAEVSAEVLLSRAETACFAPVGTLGALTVDALCDRVVEALAREGADAREKTLAAMAASLTGRYDSLMAAMERADMEPVIIEDLVDFGYDRGLEEGMERGLERGIERGIERGTELGIVRSLLDVIEARGLSCSEAEQATIAAQHDVQVLRAWHRRLLTAASVADAIA